MVLRKDVGSICECAVPNQHVPALSKVDMLALYNIISASSRAGSPAGKTVDEELHG